jgi:hypothetical protein
LSDWNGEVVQTSNMAILFIQKNVWQEHISMSL